jgi:hypothetical protein
VTAPDPATVDARLEDTLVALEAATDRFAAAVRLSAAREADYRLLHARAVVGLAQVKTTDAVRAARATHSVGDALRARAEADAEVEVAKAEMATLRTSLEVLRTLAANQRPLTG